jgi:O-succinylbenzoic acid--CoA ligase
MASLVALSLPLGPDLVNALTDCVERREAFCVIDQRLSPRAQAQQLNDLGATAIIDASGRRALDGTEVDEEIGLVMLTSGSSGTPKATELTWFALEASAQLTQGVLAPKGGTVWVPCLPPSHIGGLAVLLRTVYTDASLLWLDPEELERGPELGATHIAVVTRQLQRTDLGGYDCVLLGGAKPPMDVADNVVTTWGMTETGSGIVYDGLALPGVELATDAGELCVKSPTLFRSYRGVARPNRTINGEGDWFPTGDGGSLSPDGVLSVHGRLGYVISTGGEKVWPENLEAVLRDVPGVLDVAVRGEDDPAWGQKIVAYVVTDGRDVSEALRFTSAERIGPWAKPKDIRVVVAIPRTTNGKVRRDALTHLG